MIISIPIMIALILSLAATADAEQTVLPGQGQSSPPFGATPLSEPVDSALEQRLRQEKQARRSQFSILPHKTN